MNFDRVSSKNDGFLGLPFFKPRSQFKGKKEVHIPLIGHIPNKLRNHFVAMAGEFAGAFMFLFFAFGATSVANASAAGGGQDGSLSTVPDASTLLYISLAFGFSLAVNAWIFFRISGVAYVQASSTSLTGTGLFNPAVTLGLALVGAITWVRAAGVFIAQILGAMSAAAVVEALFPGPLSVSVALSSCTSIAQGFFIETFLTAELVFTILMLAVEKSKATFLAPVGIGLALFIGELTGVFYTGGALNPARAFGPCVVIHTFPGYHWIYWLGPVLGTMVAYFFYQMVKSLNYETANPCQDFNEKEDDNFKFNEEHAATEGDVARPDVKQEV